MKRLPLLVLTSLIFISLVLILGRTFPVYFSFPNKINPNTLKEEFDPIAKSAVFNNQKIDIPNFSPYDYYSASQVLGDTSSKKRIEVDLTNQILYAFENDKQVFKYLISSGTWGRTHPGVYHIWAKVKSQKMSGGSEDLGTYYYLPNVPFILFFYNGDTPKALGYSIHGTYWHNNFGTPMSHGCINMRTSEAAMIYDWADIDTPITIYGQYDYSAHLIRLPLILPNGTI